MDECNPVSTPMEPGNIFSNPVNDSQQDIQNKNIPYQKAIGSLMYLCQATRPDLAYCISTLSKYKNCYQSKHWTAVKRIMHYLQRTKDLCLTFSRIGSSDLVGYCDASWAPGPADPRSVTGYLFTLQGAAVSWNSKRQSTTALSSTEAEYMSLASGTQEAVWIRGFAIELGIIQDTATKLYCDNKGALELAKNAHFISRTRHINFRHHFIKELIEQGRSQLIFCCLRKC